MQRRMSRVGENVASRATRGMQERQGIDSASEIGYLAIAEPDSLNADPSALLDWKVQHTRASLRLIWLSLLRPSRHNDGSRRPFDPAKGWSGTRGPNPSAAEPGTESRGCSRPANSPIRDKAFMPRGSYSNSSRLGTA